mgnify:CR=1 FL=1
MPIKFSSPIEILCEYPVGIEPSTRLSSRARVWKKFPQRARTHLAGENIVTFGQLVVVEYYAEMDDPSLVNRLCLIPGIEVATARKTVMVLKEAGFKGTFFEGKYRQKWNKGRSQRKRRG